MATAQEVLDTAAQLGWLEPSPAPKGAANVKTECAALIPTHQGGCGCGYVSIG